LRSLVQQLERRSSAAVMLVAGAQSARDPVFGVYGSLWDRGLDRGQHALVLAGRASAIAC